VIVAVKKKPAAKKAAVKKSAAKKPVAKKSTAKKAVAKKTVKKSAVKKSAVKKSAVKKSAVKKTAKKSATKKRAVSASSVVIPPVPSASTLGAGRVDVSSTPKPASKSASAPAKPATSAAAPKQGASGKVLAAIIVGIILLAVVVVTRPDSGSDDAAPAPTASESAMPTAEPSAEATSAPVTSVEAPKAVGNWKDSTNGTMVITWKQLQATDGLTGFRVEVSSDGGKNWTSFAEVSSTESSVELSKTSEDGSTSIRVVALYSDGQEVIGNEFGFGVTLS
jgi:hypothetical protein